MRFLPRAQREAMYAVYAYCRLVDDIADEPGPLADKIAGLARWRAEIEALYQGRPHDPIARALASPIARYGLRKDDFLAVIDGLEMDAAGTMVAPSWPELERYCACVAGAVGLISVRIFGTGEAEGRALAKALGEAVQLTNVLRDVAEDAADGRLYLPREVLARHGLPLGPAAAVVSDPRVAAACIDVAAVARRRFAEAAALLAAIPRSAGRPARIMMEVYRRLLGRLERRGFARLDERVRLGRLEKLWIAVRHSWL
ncbi:MAG: presqualene diphosphate synthase HpnD [Alphaproteobacteria bacterium]|nr:presqualene diphosphate synthase HpnD [Alphaproteobacteria bacterium]